MSRRPTRLTLAVLVTAAAVAGCGGSSRPAHSATGPGSTTGAGAALSPATYHTRINAAIAPWDIAVHGLTTQITPGVLRQVAATATQGAREVAALKPPPSVTSLQSQLVDTLNRNALHAAQWARALQAHSTAAAGRFAAEFRQDGREILKLDQEYRARGVTL